MTSPRLELGQLAFRGWRPGALGVENPFKGSGAQGETDGPALSLNTYDLIAYCSSCTGSDVSLGLSAREEYFKSQ